MLGKEETWLAIIIPVAVFAVSLIALLWLRKLGYERLDKWAKKISWPADKIVLPAIKRPSIIWGFIISAYLSVTVSTLPMAWKSPTARGLWTLFLVSLVVTIFQIVGSLIIFYGQKRQLSWYATKLMRNTATIFIAIITILIVLDIWGVPSNPLDATFSWLRQNWPAVAIPVAIFALTIITLFWLRGVAYQRLNRWLNRTSQQPGQIVIQAIREPTAIWCLIISASLALGVSSLPVIWRSSSAKGLWSLFLISLTLTLLHIVDSLTLFYKQNHHLSEHTASLTRSTASIVILIILGLVLLDVWGVPTTPILLLIAVAVLTAALAFRDTVPNFFAGFQLNASQDIKVGDYIKLETGEEGYITSISWNHTHIKAFNESTIIIPNGRLIRSTVINYGHPLKKANESFRFNSRVHLTELTGLKAKNLRELADELKESPDTVVHYHTHRFLERSHYLIPEPSNDFAIWVGDALGDEVLGERLASIDTVGFLNLGALRERLVAIIEEHLAASSNGREAMPGREFHFMKSVSVILPTLYVVHDLREFIEALHKISLGSLYYHIFESKLRLTRGLNDFSIWLKDSLGEVELAEEIGRIDPYTYTLEGLRSALIQLTEKRIQ
ncbi:DUF5752 family protein [Chloroflexota bacterium]